MLGLLNEPDALAARAVIAQGVRLDRVRQVVAAVLPPAAEQVPELIPYDARAQRCLELTFQEAVRLGHSHIGPENILLALLVLDDGTGVLAGLGVDRAAAESHITAAVAATLR